MKVLAKLLAGSTAALIAATVTAGAGGYQRGQADTDILYEPGPFSARFGYTYVEPRRGFESVNGVAGSYGTYTGTYQIPSFSVKYANDIVGCAGTFTESFAAEADYSGLPGGAQPAPFNNPFGSRNRAQEFESQEFGATCRVSYDLNRGRVSVLGGVFVEDFDFSASSFANQNVTGLVAAGNPLLGGAIAPGSGTPFAGAQFIAPIGVNVDANDGYSAGFRIGAAYEIPEIALRAQILYRSEVEHDSISGSGLISGSAPTFVRLANGSIVSTQTFGNLVSAATGVAGIGNQLAASLPTTGTFLGRQNASLNTATSPASLNLNVQTGIAEGTLLLGSLRWTDWSSNRAVLTQVGAAPATVTPFYWRDGYTASIGLGRALTENISGVVSLGYDRGVSTGADTTYTDLYTVSGGVSFRNDMGELRFGGLVGYWTDGEQRISEGALFNADVGQDWVYGASASFRIGF